MANKFDERKELTELCIAESNEAMRKADIAIGYAQEGRCNAAWDMVDNAKVFADCAKQRKRSIIALAGSKLTSEERDACMKADIASAKVSIAAEAAANAVKKALEGRSRMEEEISEFEQARDYKFLKMTSTQTLKKHVSKQNGLVIPYGEHILITDKNYKGEPVAAVYEYVETPEETGLELYECRLNLIEYTTEELPDSDSALDWALAIIRKWKEEFEA